MPSSPQTFPSYWPEPGTKYRFRCESRYTAVLHRAAETIEHRINSWAKPLLNVHLGEVDSARILGQRLSVWSSLAFPRAIDDRGYWAACQALAFAVADDSFSRPEVRSDPRRIDTLHQRFHAAIRGAEPQAEEAGARLVYEALSGALPDMSSAMANRLRTTVGKAIDTSAQQARSPLLDALPLDAYLKLRGDDMWGFWTAIMTEYTLGLDMTNALAEHDELANAMQLTVDSIFYVNDLFSLNKELAAGEAFNIILIFIRDDGLTLQEAVDRLLETRERNEAEFAAVCKRIRTGALGGREDVRLYVAGLEDIYAGSLYYHFFSSRYHRSAHWNGAVPEEHSVPDYRRDRLTNGK